MGPFDLVQVEGKPFTIHFTGGGPLDGSVTTVWAEVAPLWFDRMEDETVHRYTLHMGPRGVPVKATYLGGPLTLEQSNSAYWRNW